MIEIAAGRFGMLWLDKETETQTETETRSSRNMAGQAGGRFGIRVIELYDFSNEPAGGPHSALYLEYTSISYSQDQFEACLKTHQDGAIVYSIYSSCTPRPRYL
jgi:hypothetical protein